MPNLFNRIRKAAFLNLFWASAQLGGSKFRSKCAILGVHTFVRNTSFLILIFYIFFTYAIFLYLSFRSDVIFKGIQDLFWNFNSFVFAKKLTNTTNWNNSYRFCISFKWQLFLKFFFKTCFKLLVTMGQCRLLPMLQLLLQPG